MVSRVPELPQVMMSTELQRAFMPGISYQLRRLWRQHRLVPNTLSDAVLFSFVCFFGY